MNLGLQTAVKKEILEALREHIPNLLMGIGDRSVDVNSFRPNGMLTLLIRSRPLNLSTEKVLIFGDWDHLNSFMTTRANLFKDPTRLMQAIQRNDIPSAEESFVPDVSPDPFPQLTRAQ